VIQKFVDRWMANKHLVAERYAEKHPDGYAAIFGDVVSVLCDANNEYDSPDPERITVTDHGSYSGTMLFTVACGGYTPERYWACLVDYGSCSGCDTFEALHAYSDDDEQPTPEQIDGYMTLALHMVQALKPLHSEDE
jgi:hypothetical protein